MVAIILVGYILIYQEHGLLRKPMRLRHKHK